MPSIPQHLIRGAANTLYAKRWPTFPRGCYSKMDLLTLSVSTSLPRRLPPSLLATPSAGRKRSRPRSTAGPGKGEAREWFSGAGGALACGCASRRLHFLYLFLRSARGRNEYYFLCVQLVCTRGCQQRERPLQGLLIEKQEFRRRRRCAGAAAALLARAERLYYLEQCCQALHIPVKRRQRPRLSAESRPAACRAPTSRALKSRGLPHSAWLSGAPPAPRLHRAPCQSAVQDSRRTVSAHAS